MFLYSIIPHFAKEEKGKKRFPFAQYARCPLFGTPEAATGGAALQGRIFEGGRLRGAPIQKAWSAAVKVNKSYKLVSIWLNIIK